MQFRVPQFIDLEDKIIGPLTLKQFGYVLGALGFTFILWTLIPIKIIAIILIVPIVALFLSLAFLKINNRPFGDILESAFTFYTSSKVYTWKQPGADMPKPVQVSTQGEQLVADTIKLKEQEKADQNKLHNIALDLDAYDKSKETPFKLVGDAPVNPQIVTPQ